MVLTDCCCCKLRTGGLIIGWVGLCLNVFYLVCLLILRETVTDLDTRYLSDTKTKGHYDAVILISYIAAIAIDMLMHLLLLLGIHKEKPKLMSAWLWTSAIKIVMNCVQLVVEGINGKISEFVLTGFGICLFVYFWVCVRALYKQIIEKNNTPASGVEDAQAGPADKMLAYNMPPPYKV